jgi:hypothetical protein
VELPCFAGDVLLEAGEETVAHLCVGARCFPIIGCKLPED